MTLDDLKAAHKAGHTIQVYLTGSKIWRDLPNPLWNSTRGVSAYRVKPTVPEEFKTIKFRLFLYDNNSVVSVGAVTPSSFLSYGSVESMDSFKCWLSDEICLGDM